MQKNKFVPIAENECCGCGSCETVCPKRAISMLPNHEGFLYPNIDENACIQCGICVKVCGFYNSEHKSLSEKLPICYIAKYNDVQVRMNSRSGGAFVGLTEWIFARGGVVYGCVMDENLKAIHIRANHDELRNLMCKSKYVQSDTTGIFKSVEDDLNSGVKVLFSGTGCQIGSLLYYLKHKNINVDNLYTVDFICHGVPSPLLFEDFKSWLENKYNDKLLSFNFRDKSVCGWDGHVETAEFEHTKYRGIFYRELFYTNMALRPSCYNCKYITPGEHVADMTIGDAWGIKEAKPEFNDNRGVSVCLCNSDKGEELLNYLYSVATVVELPLQGAMLQPNLVKPSSPKGNREEFWHSYNTGGIELLIKKYATRSMMYKLKSTVKYLLRKLLQGKKYYLP